LNELGEPVAVAHFRIWHEREVPTGSEIVCLSG